MLDQPGEDALTYLAALASGAFTIWFMFWGLRRSYELDDQLTRKERVIRWSVVIAGFALALIEGSDTAAEIIRVGGVLIAFAFLAWPNFAHMVGELVAKKKTQTPP